MSSSTRNGIRLHPAVGPFCLLTVLTSLAFNRAALARKAAEEERRHLVQINLLQEELRKLIPRLSETPSPSSSSTTSPSWLQRFSRSSSKASVAGGTSPKDARVSHADEEDQLLARRCLAVGLDPSRIGISAELIPLHSSMDGPDVAWSEALFGTGVWTKMKSSLIQAGEALRGTVAAGLQPGLRQTEERSGEEEIDGKGEQHQQDEYESAFLAYAKRLEDEERFTVNTVPRAKDRSLQLTETLPMPQDPSALFNTMAEARSSFSESTEHDQATPPIRSSNSQQQRSYPAEKMMGRKFVV